MDSETKIEFLKRHRDRAVGEQVKIAECFDVEIRQLESQLAEAEKPELREGGYGWDDIGPFFLWESSCLWNKQYGPGRNTCISRSLNKKGNDKKLAVWATQVTGNVLDDLKAMAEDLEKAETVSLAGLTTTYWIDKAGDLLIDIKTNEKQTVVKTKDIPTLILNLRRMYATQERKKNGNTH